MGWDIDRFPEPDKDLVCCICTGILDDPVETRCRHVYCRECLETWNRTRPVCPTCREVVNPRDVRAVNPVLKNIIGKQMISCDHKANGCEENTTIDLLESHLEECKYKLEECTNHGCTVQTLRGEAVEHARVCPKRLVTCQRGCDLVMTQDESEDHNCLSALRTHFTDKINELEGRMQKLEDKVWSLCQRTDQPAEIEVRERVASTMNTQNTTVEIMDPFDAMDDAILLDEEQDLFAGDNEGPTDFLIEAPAEVHTTEAVPRLLYRTANVERSHQHRRRRRLHQNPVDRWFHPRTASMYRRERHGITEDQRADRD